LGLEAKPEQACLHAGALLAAFSAVLAVRAGADAGAVAEGQPRVAHHLALPLLAAGGAALRSRARLTTFAAVGGVALSSHARVAALLVRAGALKAARALLAARRAARG